MISNPKVVITDYDYGDLEIEKGIRPQEKASNYVCPQLRDLNIRGGGWGARTDSGLVF